MDSFSYGRNFRISGQLGKHASWLLGQKAMGIKYGRLVRRSTQGHVAVPADTARNIGRPTGLRRICTR